MMFDEVLRKGFSAQTFAAGLNGHFRDLLMCKNPQTLSLLEVTGSVAERYRSQAAECPVPLLFEGIDLLTAVEQSLRTAVNQRLRVELSLMKLCGLGQKKNDGALSPSLPELSSSRSVPTAPAAPPKPSAEGIVSPTEVEETAGGEASSGTIPAGFASAGIRAGGNRGPFRCRTRSCVRRGSEPFGSDTGRTRFLVSKREQDCLRRFRPSGVGCAVRTTNS